MPANDLLLILGHVLKSEVGPDALQAKQKLASRTRLRQGGNRQQNCDCEDTKHVEIGSTQPDTGAAGLSYNPQPTPYNP